MRALVPPVDGTLHVTYNHHLPDALGKGQQGKAGKAGEAGKAGKTIEHAWFAEAWLLEGEDGG